MNEQFVEFIMNAVVVVAIFMAFILVGYSAEVNHMYLFGFIPLILLLLLSFYVAKRVIFSILMKNFIQDWGKPVNRKRNINRTKILFNNIKKDKPKEFYIDDQTFSDLTMEELYKDIDRTITSPGEEMLYHMLRSPLFNIEKLKERNKLTNLFEKNEKFRNEIGGTLLKLGKVKKNYVPDFLWSDIEVNMSYKFLCIILGIMPIILVILAAITKSGYFILAIMGVVVVNFTVHNKIKKNIYGYVSGITYLNAVVRAASDISKLKVTNEHKYIENLTTLVRGVSNIATKSRGIGRVEGLDQTGVMDVIFVLFLIEENQFFSYIKLIKQYKEELKEIYKYIGEIDALLSVASYKKGRTICSEPELTEEGLKYEAQDIVHPLLKEPVANSVTMDEKGILLTGSNMSGKSTFLRTIGINALLAETIYITTAKSYKASLFKIMTSISPEDNIMGGKSYYFREAEALLRIIEEDTREYPLICIIDEIFRGTNPVERINASIEILAYLNAHRALPIVATHDLELTDMLKKEYNLFYFTEDIEKDGMVFDYKLKNGVCNTRNAVKLLKYLNYPKEIIENTNKRIERDGDKIGI